MRLDSGLSWSILYDFCFGDCLEVVGGYHDFNDAFTEVTDLNPYIPKDYIFVPYPYNNYCLQTCP